MSTPTNRQPLRDRLRAALTASMKARDAAGTSALRAALAAIDNAEAVDESHRPRGGAGPIAGAVRGLRSGEVPRLTLTEQEVDEIVRREVAELRSSAADYEQLGRREHAARLHAEAEVLSTCMGADDA